MMSARKRRDVAEWLALLALDEFVAWCDRLSCDVFPDELRALQREFEDVFYRELHEAGA